MINMPLGTEVGLGPNDIVLDRGPAPLPKGGGAEPHPQFLAHVSCGQTAGCIKVALGMEMGLDPGHIVLASFRRQKGGRALPNFRPIFIVAKRLDASCHWYGAPQPRRLCDFVFDEDPATPRKKGTPTPPNFWPMSCGQTAGWMKTPLGTEVDLDPGHIVLDGIPAVRQRGTATPLFDPCLLWPRSPISATAELLLFAYLVLYLVVCIFCVVFWIFPLPCTFHLKTVKCQRSVVLNSPICSAHVWYDQTVAHLSY